jgi:hypothetical protein
LRTSQTTCQNIGDDKMNKQLQNTISCDWKKGGRKVGAADRKM